MLRPFGSLFVVEINNITFSFVRDMVFRRRFTLPNSKGQISEGLGRILVSFVCKLRHTFTVGGNGLDGQEWGGSTGVSSGQ